MAGRARHAGLRPGEPAGARNIRVDLALIAAGLLFGCLLDGTLSRSGLARYAAGWPDPAWAPGWILALWVSFALTFSQVVRYLQTRLWLAALLGLVGGPLAYLGAARGWQVVTFAEPTWRAVLALALGWALATPALAWLARIGRPDAAAVDNSRSPRMNPWWQLLLVWLLAALVMTLGWQWQRRRSNAGIVDVLWAAGVGGSAVLLAIAGSGAPWTRAVLALLGGAWGLRLSAHLWRRVRGEAETTAAIATCARTGRARSGSSSPSSSSRRC
ncbi:hypothetical protein RLIN73S_00007 [Rhodanobacter lindaniclasticus]